MSDFRYVPPGSSPRPDAPGPEGPRAAKRSPKASAPPRMADEPVSKQRNVEPILSLGDVRYFSYRHGVYRVPPVPFKLGQRVLDSHVKVLAHAKQVAMTGDMAPTKAYYAELARLARLLWTHIRPTGKFRRLLWRLGLLRNPFAVASEAEMKAVTSFFLQGRMTSSVQYMSEAEAHA